MAGPPRLGARQRRSLIDAELARVRSLSPDPARLGTPLTSGLRRQAAALVTGKPDWLASDQLRRRSDALVEFLMRLERDQPTLQDRFGVTGAPITLLRTGCSDPHHGGRTVFRFRIGAGPLLYYKPRDGRIEAAWYGLVEQLASPELASPPRMVLASDCCWVENIGDGGVDSEILSRSAGALLAVLDLVQAADLHPANLSRRESRLMPIDLETVCHPTLPWENAAMRDPADPVSVLRVGMLGGPAHAVPVLPSPLAEGFRAMYRRLESEAVDRFVRTIASLPARVLIRATARYRAAWRASRATSVAEESERRAAIDRALARGRRGLRSVVPEELRMLEAGMLARFDIPRFTARTDEIAVRCDSTGRQVPNVCVSSGLARMAERRRVHGAKDLAGRLAALRSGLALEQARASLRRSGGRPA